MNRDWNVFFWGRTDDDGKFKIDCLLTGVRLGARVEQTGAGRATLFQKMTLKPGETRDLGEVKVKFGLD